MKRGQFIVIEGIDGAGTTTQSGELARELSGYGIQTLVTREPSPGPVGLLTRLALSKRLVVSDGKPISRHALALLFAADRVDHVETEIAPALARGEWVISDRYVLSSMAYQSLDAKAEWVAALNVYAMPADVTYFLKVSEEIASQRRKQRGSAKELFEVAALQRKIARNYESTRSLRPNENVVVVDGRASREKVTEVIVADLVKRFHLKQKSRRS